MPLSNGIRPWNESMPTKEDGGAQIQKYTSNTTDPINGLLNECKHDGPVHRDDLENSLMRMGYARGRKQILDALYGIEPDETNPVLKRIGLTGNIADKEKFLRRILGKKVVGVWQSGKIIKKGAGIHYENEGNEESFLFHERKEEDDEDDEPSYSIQSPRKLPLSPNNQDKTRTTRPSSAPIDRLAASFQKSADLGAKAILAHPDAIVLAPVFAEKLCENQQHRPISAKPLAELLREFRLRPGQSLPILHQILATTFDNPCIWVDRYDRIHLLCRRDRRFLREELSVCVEDHISGCQITAAPQSPPRNPAAGYGSANSDEAMDSEAGRHSACPVSPGRTLTLAGTGIGSGANLRLDVKPPSLHLGTEGNYSVRTTRQSAGPICSEEDSDMVKSGNDGENTTHLKETAPRLAAQSKVPVSSGGTSSEIPAWRELLDSPRYWYDSRIVSRRDDTPRDPLLSHRQVGALKRAVQEPEDFVFRRGRIEVSARAMAAQALQRASRDSQSAALARNINLGYAKYVQSLAGVSVLRNPQNGRDDVAAGTPGASFGASVFRLVPTHVFHDGKQTRHPVLKPPSARIKSKEQFDLVCDLLQRPCVDGNGNMKSDGPSVHRLPLSTPRGQRQKIVAKAMAEAIAARESPPASCRTSPTTTSRVVGSQIVAAGDTLSSGAQENQETKDPAVPAPVKFCSPQHTPRRPQSSLPNRPSSSPSLHVPVARRRPTTAPRRPDSSESLEFSTWPYFE